MLRVQKINYQIEQGPHEDDVRLVRTDRAGVITLWPRLLETRPPQRLVCDIGPSRPDDVVESMLDKVRELPQRQVVMPMVRMTDIKNFLINMGIATAACVLLPGFGVPAAIKWGACFGATIALPFARTQGAHFRADNTTLGFCEAAEVLRGEIISYTSGHGIATIRSVTCLNDRVREMCRTDVEREYHRQIKEFALRRGISLDLTATRCRVL